MPHGPVWEILNRRQQSVSWQRDEPLPWKPGWAGTTLMTYPYAFYHETAGAETVVPVDEGVVD